MKESGLILLRSFIPLKPEQMASVFIKKTKLRILCVDDQPYNIYVISMMLKLINSLIEVDEAHNG